MNNHHHELERKFKKYAVPVTEIFKQLTPEQKRLVGAEVQKYYILQEIRRLRKKLGLTQVQLANRASLPRTTISKIESGTYNPTINTLMIIAAAMNLHLTVKFSKF